MRRFMAVTAAALVLAACETSNNQQRQNRVPSETIATPPDETRPLDSSPMRGDETYPGEYTMPGTGREPNTGLSGAQIDRGASTSIPGERAGRRESGASTVRPDPAAPPRGTPSTTTPAGIPIPADEGFENPYDLGAAKTPKDAGTAAVPDGGSHFESSPPGTGSW